MKAEPLSKAIYEKAKELGVNTITLKFSGGSDEGELEVDTDGKDYDYDFVRLVEDWAWDVYNYSGAGEGIGYGDDIMYDLKNGKVSTSEWVNVVQEQKGRMSKLKIEKD